MTLEEAKALVLEEGMMTEPVPDNAMAMLLHAGKEPDKQHIEPLMEALWVVSQGLKGQALLNRKLAAALWILGVEASAYLDLASQKADPTTGAAPDWIIDLMTAVESVFFDDWFVEERNKIGVTSGERQHPM